MLVMQNNPSTSFQDPARPVQTVPEAEERAPLLRLRGIVKAFPNVVAVNGVDLDVHAGEIHALLGENGSGKSTLMKIVYGIYDADSGEVLVEGKPVRISNPRVAVAHGIGMVHQHFTLVPSLTVLENLMLGYERCVGPFLDRRSMGGEIAALFDRIRLPSVPFDARVETLSVGEQQRVEIIKAMLRGAKLLFLDEPTAVLTPQEAEQLGRFLTGLREQGYGIVLITHKLEEVFAFSNRVTVLRRGHRVGTRLTEEVDRSSLASLMVGRPIESLAKDPVKPGEEMFALDRVTVTSPGARPFLDNVSLAVRRGEILGIAGVAGNGQQPLAEVLTGLRAIDSGERRLGQARVEPWTIHQSLQAGVGYIPEDRQSVGLVLELTVAENLVLKSADDKPFSRWGRLDWPRIRAHAAEMISRYDIRPPMPDARVGLLSGGNQQKVILARELSPNGQMIVAAEPTRGLDIGSVDFVHRTLLDQRAKGSAIVLISTDLDEIISLSDRVAVMFEGRIVRILERDEITRDQLGTLMSGAAKGDET
jgi:simple sugar transport system ATP-binding protein